MFPNVHSKSRQIWSYSLLPLFFVRISVFLFFFFFFQAEDGIRDRDVTGVQTCALPISTPLPYSLGFASARTPSPARGEGKRVRCWRFNSKKSLSEFSNACLPRWPHGRSEEHTSELQSHHDLVCRLLLEKKKN